VEHFKENLVVAASHPNYCEKEEEEEPVEED